MVAILNLLAVEHASEHRQNPFVPGCPRVQPRSMWRALGAEVGHHDPTGAARGASVERASGQQHRCGNVAAGAGDLQT